MEGQMKGRIEGLMVGQTDPSLQDLLDCHLGSNNDFEKEEVLLLISIYHIY